MQERFQRSGDTISKVFHRLLNCIVSPTFYNRYVKLPPNDHTPPEIRENPKLYPFFKSCRGALDGTHIDAFVPDEDSAAYRDRKGRLSTNVRTVQPERGVVGRSGKDTGGRRRNCGKHADTRRESGGMNGKR
ncbi:hypothetical protein BDN70DRAFT_819343 [Pholiota conissans]|uniref:DDE Tnp4 domain-containing protein n=1 Tax=Pholiota conissans TaxID=109636 RepID=A0A9P5YQ80_9AGAR|nr:hypothetical protein BDN70DRAFT_819343 [Pholiota conissans]